MCAETTHPELTCYNVDHRCCNTSSDTLRHQIQISTMQLVLLLTVRSLWDQSAAAGRASVGKNEMKDQSQSVMTLIMISG